MRLADFYPSSMFSPSHEQAHLPSMWNVRQSSMFCSLRQHLVRLLSKSSLASCYLSIAGFSLQAPRTHHYSVEMKLLLMYWHVTGWESHISSNDGFVGSWEFATQSIMQSDDNFAYSSPTHMPFFSVPSWTGSKFKFNAEMSGETDVFACSRSQGTRRPLLYHSDVSRLASLALESQGNTILFPDLFSLLVNGCWIVSRTFATFSKLIFSCVSQPANMMNCGDCFSKVSQV